MTPSNEIMAYWAITARPGDSWNHVARYASGKGWRHGCKWGKRDTRFDPFPGEFFIYGTLPSRTDKRSGTAYRRIEGESTRVGVQI